MHTSSNQRFQLNDENIFSNFQIQFASNKFDTLSSCDHLTNVKFKN